MLISFALLIYVFCESSVSHVTTSPPRTSTKTQFEEESEGDFLEDATEKEGPGDFLDAPEEESKGNFLEDANNVWIYALLVALIVCISCCAVTYFRVQNKILKRQLRESSATPYDSIDDEKLPTVHTTSANLAIVTDSEQVMDQSSLQIRTKSNMSIKYSNPVLSNRAGGAALFSDSQEEKVYISPLGTKSLLNLSDVSRLSLVSERSNFTSTMVNNLWKSLRIDAELIEIEHFVSSGQFGNVYKAKYCGAPVAVKSVHSNQDFEIIMNEGKFWASNPKHPNLCHLVGWADLPEQKEHSASSDVESLYEDEIRLNLIMEWVENGSVRQCLRKKHRFNLAQKYQIILQVARGLRVLHMSQRVHRDVALRNVLINLQTMQVKLTDFGLSGKLKKGQQMKLAKDDLMPLAWCAPEVLKDFKYRKESDIWAFGVLIWELMAEKKPFADEDIHDVILDIKDGSRTLQCEDSWPETIKNTCINCWKYDPEDRIDISEIQTQIEQSSELKTVGGDITSPDLGGDDIPSFIPLN